MFWQKKITHLDEIQRKEIVETIKKWDEEDSKKTYNIFLDDVRTPDIIYKTDCPEFVVLRSYHEFLHHIINSKSKPAFISFDNDLGEDEKGRILPDGYACAKWLVYESGLDLKELKFNVHSSNPVAAEQIRGLLNNYLKHINE
jgi:hypothetical protein